MRVAIHQPEHLPWGGFFAKMALADLFIVLDDAAFSKGNVHNRNRILSREGAGQWLSVPVHQRGVTRTPLRDVRIFDASWTTAYLQRIQNAYREAPFFEKVEPRVSAVVESGHRRLIDLNLDLIHVFREAFAISTPLAYSSQIGGNGSGSQRVANLVRLVGGNEYLSGTGGSAYLDPRHFTDAGISIRPFRFTPSNSVGSGRWTALSVLHYCMHFGSSAMAISGATDHDSPTDG